eukprot:scaffold185421_cov18-Tisochrysis_lutea.AAC.1
MAWDGEEKVRGSRGGGRSRGSRLFGTPLQNFSWSLGVGAVCLTQSQCHMLKAVAAGGAELGGQFVHLLASCGCLEGQ